MKNIVLGKISYRYSSKKNEINFFKSQQVWFQVQRNDHGITAACQTTKTFPFSNSALCQPQEKQQGAARPAAGFRRELSLGFGTLKSAAITAVLFSTSTFLYLVLETNRVDMLQMVSIAETLCSTAINTSQSAGLSVLSPNLLISTLSIYALDCTWQLSQRQVGNCIVYGLTPVLLDSCMK